MNQLDNKAHCPFCHGENDCRLQQSQGTSTNACWCQSLAIPQGLIDLLPNKDIDARCICKQCILRYAQNDVAFVNQLRRR